IPILVGGDTEVAIRRAARLADGYFPGEGDADRLAELIAAVRVACDNEDRDPDTVEINAMFGAHFKDPARGVEVMRELGVGRVMVPAFFFGGDGGLDRLRAFGETVVAPGTD
ncbi:MAG: LLM class flavin-dependent oxidoreductase, partial [Acidimicrobiales bacterium]